MRLLITSSLMFVLLAISTPGRAQLGEINLLTDLGTPFPPGCISIGLPNQPRSEDSLLIDNDFSVPSVNSNSRDATVNVQIWRVACADEGYSVVMVRLEDVDNDIVLVPQMFVKTGATLDPFGADREQHQAQLQSLPVGGNIGAAGDIIPFDGATWVLAVDPISINPRDPDNLRDSEIFTPEEYNDVFTIEMTWDFYSRADTSSYRLPLDLFDPAIDPPQFDQTILNGRHSGLFLKAGAERQGLVIQVAEQGDGNFIFAIFFTFIDGEPIWVVSNSAAVPMEPGPITMRADIPRGGAFMTDINQPSLDEIDLDRAGEISVEAVDCNNIKVHYDFSPINKGTGTLDLFRLVRTAGYDCNPWE